MATGNLGALIASLQLDTTEFQKALKDAENQLNNAGGSMKKSMKPIEDTLNKLGQSMASVGRSMSLYITAPMLLVGKSAITASKDFELALSRITGLVGVSRTQVNAWRKDIMIMADELGKSPQELAEALYYITSSGLESRAALDVLAVSAKASAAGLGDTQTVANAVSSALIGYKGSLKSAAEATDIMVNAVRLGKAEASDLVTAFGIVTPIAAQMGLEFHEIAGAIAAMSRVEPSAETAAVQLRQILGQLMGPSEEAKKAFTSIGWSAKEMREQIANKGLFSALTTFTSKIEEFSNIEGADKIFGNIRAITGTFNLTGKSIEENRKVMDDMTKSAGWANKAFEEYSQTLEYQWQKTLANYKTALIAIGDTLREAVIPILQKATSAFKGIAAWFSSLSDSGKRVVTIMGAIATAIGPVIFIIGKLVTSIIAIKKAIQALSIVASAHPLVALLTVAAAGIATYMLFKDRTEELTEAHHELGQAIGEVNAEAGKTVFDAAMAKKWDEYAKAIRGTSEETKGLEEDTNFLSSAFSKWWGHVENVGKGIKDIFPNMDTDILSPEDAKEATAQAKKAFAAVTENIKKSKVDMVEAFKDTLPTMTLSELQSLGEYIKSIIPNLEAEAVRGASETAIKEANDSLTKYRSVLDMVNSEIDATLTAVKSVKDLTEQDNTLKQLTVIEVPTKFAELDKMGAAAKGIGDKFDVVNEKITFLKKLLYEHADMPPVVSYLTGLINNLKGFTGNLKGFASAINIKDMIQIQGTSGIFDMSSIQQKITKEFKIIENSFKAFGGFDVLTEKMNFLKDEIQKLINDGFSLISPEVMYLQKALDSIKMPDEFATFKDVMDKLKASFTDLETKFSLSGGFDLVASKIDVIKSAMDSLDLSIASNVLAYNALKALLLKLNTSAKGTINAMDGVKQAMGSAISDMVTALATPLEEGETIFGNILKVVASFISSVGQALIMAGVAALKFETILMDPTGAIVFGAAMVALGAILSAGISSGEGSSSSSKTQRTAAFANGGLVYGPTVGLVGEYAGASSNPEVIAPLNKLKSLITDTESASTGIVEFKIKSGDLHGVLKQYSKKINSYK